MVLNQFTGLRSMRPLPGRLLSLVGPVLAPATVTLNLSTDC